MNLTPLTNDVIEARVRGRLGPHRHQGHLGFVSVDQT